MNTKTCFCLLAVTALLAGALLPLAGPAQAQTTTFRADAVVIVNSASAEYLDFEHYIQPYLDHFGIPYDILDISSSAVQEAVGQYALIILGHRQLDPDHVYLDATEEGNLSAAVSGGAGLVNLDNDLSTGGVGRYTFVQDVFGFGYGGATSGSGVTFPGGTLHYIAERHTPGESLSTGGMSLPGVTLPGDVSAVASTGTQPFIAVTTHGAGRAVQWSSYDWMSVSVRGPVYGLDDLVWRSLVWAARKPFVMQGMPPFLTMRVDDESGNFEWIHIANEFGILPWAGLFYYNVDETEAADLSALTNAGLATASVHAKSGAFFYYNHGVGDFSDAEIAANFAHATAWHQTYNIPIAEYVLPHYYEFGTNVFQGLSDWGVEFVGTQMNPGAGYGAPWIMNGPFRKYETGSSSGGLPQYYADFMAIPNHPEFTRSASFPGFFNCVTEIRDDAGYEWYPNLNDVAGTIGRGTRQTKRALDGMELATLFTHGYYVAGSWGASAPANWRAILQGIMDNLSAYEPIPVTMDYACRYIRATTTSDIASASYDATTNQVTTNFSGVTDIPTRFYLFMDGEANVMVDVPTFDGTATVNYTIPGPLDHIVVSPNPATIVAGTSQEFSAVGYDAGGNPIPNLTFAWSVANGGGTIDAGGRFTAGVTPGTFPDTVVATRGAVSGSATVTVTEPVLHHFEFAPITSPKYLDAPFSVTIRARDDAGNLVVGYAGTAALTDSTGTVTPGVTGAFTAGVWTGQVTIGAAAGSVILTATGSGVSGSSNPFDVLSAPTCPCSIWAPGTTPANPFNADAQAVEVGTKFRAATDGYITALRFYRGAANPGTTFVGHLWAADGTLLAEETYPAGTPAGWQQVALSSPVPITADTTYIVSYHTTTGYAVNRPYFVEANRALFERPPLRALVDGEQGGNGVYRYDQMGGSHFPTETYESSNYWADVVLVTDLTPPEVCVDEDCSLWDDSFTPAEPAFVDPQTQTEGVELGVRFRPSLNGYITGLRFYRGSGNTTEHPGHLWASDGTLLATLTFPAGATVGWQQALFDTPVPVLAGQIYVASYHSATNWARTLNYFVTGRDNPPLYAFATAEVGGPNGLYRYGTPGAFPDGTYNASNYWVDVLFRTQIQDDATAPIVDSTTPAPNAVDVAADADVTATFSEAVDPATVSGSTFELRDPSDALVAATVTYDQATHTARLDPSDALEFATGYTAVVKGGAYGIMDLAGNPMLGDHTWSFTTAAAPPTLDHLRFAAIASPQTAGVPFAITVTAYDTNGNVFAGYAGPAALSASTGALSPAQTGAFTNGAWTGLVTIASDVELSGVTLSATDGSATGLSDSFDVQLPPPAPPFYTVTSASYDQWTGVPFEVTVTAYPGVTVNLWEDAHQEPVLPTFTDPLLLNDHDGNWDEFHYLLGRPFPALLAGHNEWENNGLEPMHFFAMNIPNGQYQVYADLYTPYATRYYYGYTEAEALANARYVDNVVGAGGSLQFAEHLLGTVDITTGRFDLWAGDGDTGGTQYFYGWAHIRLAPVTSAQQINLWEDAHQEPVLPTTTNPAALIETDGVWTEFSYPASRPFPGVFAAVNEENYGLPVMRFYAGGIPNGTYEVVANLYDNAPLRYYYGYTAAEPKALSVDLPGCFAGTQFREYSLGNVTITDGNFNLYVRDADIRTGTTCGNTYPFFGWAWIRLVSQGLTMSSSSMTMQFDGDGDGVFDEPGDDVKQLVDGTFNIMAQEPTAGTDVIIRADDTDARFGFNTYNILASNEPPVLDPIDDQTVDEMTELAFTATATDPDLDDTLAFSLAGAPAGASIDPAMGVFTWTPTEDQGPGTYAFNVCAGDAEFTACAPVNVTVNEVNLPPALDSIGDQTVDEETALAFTATATDPDVPANSLTFGLEGAPAGASIDPATGAFAWTPTEEQGPGDYPLDVCVSDGALSDCEAITVTVNEVNVAPVLASIGDQALVWGNLLSFTATATDPDFPANTLTFSLADAPTGAGITPGGAFTWTPTGLQVGSHSITVRVTDNGTPSLYDEKTFTVDVGKRQTRVTYIGDLSGQYSDGAEVVAVLVDNGTGALWGTPIAGKSIVFALGSQAATDTTDALGVAERLLYLVQPAGSYTISASFSEDAAYLGDSDSQTFAIGAENAEVAFAPDNPVAVRVATAGGSSGPFPLIAYVSEMFPDAGANPHPGDINLAQVSVSLQPVGPGSPVVGTCTRGTGGSDYDAVLAVTCNFAGVPVNTYTVLVAVNGGYYAGSAEDVLVVYDPSLGFTTGGGWFYWPGTTDRTNFGYTMKYNKKGTNVQGSLLLIRHLADGTIYRVKSNALNGLSLGQATSMGWASFSGKCTYLEPGWLEPIGNYEFVVYVEDRNEPGTGTDRFWIKVTRGISMVEPATTNAVPINGGNIVVPHK